MASSKLCLLSLVCAFAFNVYPHGMATNAPPELMHFGKLVGHWSTTEESFKRDGTGWEPSKGADWSMYWAYDGWGVRDVYVSPPLSEAIEDESKRQRGINLRVYKPDEKKWIMTWLATSSKKASNFSATSTDDQVVMMSDEVDAQGNHNRITFFDMTETSFEWKLEWSSDLENWLEVYRIHGTRK